MSETALSQAVRCPVQRRVTIIRLVFLIFDNFEENAFFRNKYEYYSE